MNDKGSLHHFLGLEVHATSKEIFLNQRKYTTNLISFAGFVDATPVDTPMEVNLRLRKEGELLSNPTLYRQLAGSLFYLTITLSRHCFCCSTSDPIPSFSSPSSHGCSSSHHTTYELLVPFDSPLTLTTYYDTDWLAV